MCVSCRTVFIQYLSAGSCCSRCSIEGFGLQAEPQGVITSLVPCKEVGLLVSRSKALGALELGLQLKV